MLNENPASTASESTTTSETTSIPTPHPFGQVKQAEPYLTLCFALSTLVIVAFYMSTLLSLKKNARLVKLAESSSRSNRS